MVKNLSLFFNIKVNDGNIPPPDSIFKAFYILSELIEKDKRMWASKHFIYSFNFCFTCGGLDDTQNERHYKISCNDHPIFAGQEVSFTILEH